MHTLSKPFICLNIHLAMTTVGGDVRDFAFNSGEFIMTEFICVD